MAEVTKKICSRCSKRVSTRGIASFTGWIFQESICTCARTARTKMIASEVRLVSAPSLNPMLVSSDAGSPPNIGTRYQVCELIGSGGMGAVYRVMDRELNKEFAIKVLLSELVADRMTVKRFEQEARTVAALTHPNLAAIYGQGKSDNGAPYLVMDLVVGPSLADLLLQEYCLDTPTVIDICSQVADALAYAHAKGVVHRDLKPSNILICSETGLVKLVDFGIAKLLPTNEQGQVDLTRTGDIFGSPLYMSPEQCQGDNMDARSDIYSMGCVMYEMMTGVPPFSGANPIKIILAHLNELPKPPSQISPMAKIPRALEQVVLHCLEKNPDKRYQSMNALKHDLDLLREGRQPTVINDDQTNARKKKRALVISTAITSCLIVALTGMSTLKLLQPKPSSTVADRTDLAQQHIVPHKSARHVSVSDNGRQVIMSDVSDQDLQALDQLTVTQDVSITRSDLNGPGLAHLIHLNFLRNLNLSHTHLNARGMSEIKHLRRLKYLDLGSTGIMDSDLEFLVGLEELVFLDLSGNDITSTGLKHLLALKKLEHLDLTGNKVSANELEMCGKMPALSQLSLKRTDAADDMLKYLPTIKNLRTISLGGTNIGDGGIAEVAKCSKIMTIDLDGTQITDQSLGRLGGMKSLKMLDVTDCKNISEAGLGLLREQNPRMNIKWSTAPSNEE